MGWGLERKNSYNANIVFHILGHLHLDGETRRILEREAAPFRLFLGSLNYYHSLSFLIAVIIIRVYLTMRIMTRQSADCSWHDSYESSVPIMTMKTAYGNTPTPVAQHVGPIPCATGDWSIYRYTIHKENESNKEFGYMWLLPTRRHHPDMYRIRISKRRECAFCILLMLFRHSMSIIHIQYNVYTIDLLDSISTPNADTSGIEQNVFLCTMAWIWRRYDSSYSPREIEDGSEFQKRERKSWRHETRVRILPRPGSL